MEIVELFNHPGNSNVEVAAGFVMKLGFNTHEGKVSVTIAPNILDYQENADQPGILVRQAMTTQDTQDTLHLEFDYDENNILVIEDEGKVYDIELLENGKRVLPEYNNQEFPYAKFRITESQQ
jgi:hypothetical protein